MKLEKATGKFFPRPVKQGELNEWFVSYGAELDAHIAVVDVLRYVNGQSRSIDVLFDAIHRGNGTISICLPGGLCPVIERLNQSVVAIFSAPELLFLIVDLLKARSSKLVSSASVL